MNNIDKIIARIHEDAEAEARHIAAQTKVKCDAIRAEADENAKNEYWRLFKKGTNDAEARLNRLGGTAQMESKKMVLREKQRLIAEAFNAASLKLRLLPDNGYVKLMAKLACSASETGSETLIFNAGDREKYGAQVCSEANLMLKECGRPAALTVSDETRSISGGVIVSGGRIEVNCSTDVLIDSYRAELTSPVAAVLF